MVVGATRIGPTRFAITGIECAAGATSDGTAGESVCIGGQARTSLLGEDSTIAFFAIVNLAITAAGGVVVGGVIVTNTALINNGRSAPSVGAILYAIVGGVIISGTAIVEYRCSAPSVRTILSAIVGGVIIAGTAIVEYR